MKSKIAVVAAAVALAGCAVHYPQLDPRTMGPNTQRDLQECERLANAGPGAGESAATGAVVGAVVFGLLGAALGVRASDAAAFGAGVGAVHGAGQGAGGQQGAMNRCMQGRGYNVLR